MKTVRKDIVFLTGLLQVTTLQTSAHRMNLLFS